MFRQPGSIYKFKPEAVVKTEIKNDYSKEDLEKRYGREFIDDEKIALELLEDGYVVRQRLASPMATWFFSPTNRRSPNMTGNMFRRMKKEGLIEHKLDQTRDTPFYAEYIVTKHGMRTLETYRRKESKVAGDSEPIEFIEHVLQPGYRGPEVTDTDMPSFNTKALGTLLPKKEYLEPVTQVEPAKEVRKVSLPKGDSVVSSCKFIPLASGSHLLVAEFTDEVSMLRAARFLGLSESKVPTVEPVVQSARKGGGEVKCDFCNQIYHSGLIRKNVWLRYCRTNPECLKSYSKLSSLFKSLNGRNPSPADRESSLQSIDVVR